jgi:regulatory protein
VAFQLLFQVAFSSLDDAHASSRLFLVRHAMALNDPPRPPGKPRAPASLKMQAIGYLSRREHSRLELRAKLLAAIRRRERDEAALAAAVAAHDEAVGRALRETPSNGIDDAFAPRAADRPAVERTHAGRGPASAAVPETATDRDPEAEVDALLDWLEAHGYLSDARFVESRVHARAARQGTLRIKHELARHGLVLEPAQAAGLRESEFARAHAIWQRKFGTVAADARERAKQARFLAARGFAADVVWRIVGGEDA